MGEEENSGLDWIGLGREGERRGGEDVIGEVVGTM